MKRYIVHNGKIYYANCKKTKDGFILSDENSKDVTEEVLNVVKEYLLSLNTEEDNDPGVLFTEDSSILRLFKPVKGKPATV